MNLKSVKFTEELAKEVTTWKYEGDYEIYNLPSWDEVLKKQISLCREEKRKNFIGYVNEQNNLVGFVNLVDEEDSVFLGIGVKPKYCGVGIGKQIIKMSLDECKKRYKNKPIILEVRSWNKRAINCYESQGFKVINIKKQETYAGFGEFFVMKYE
ncbi:acetyltransferase [[Clostridium] sordellii]|uniref:GNAT family N-acetyltransferase n=1 Tax=Paraclostridium sordellii TaxID=1505 RepID=UPI0005E6F383|nr:GNAT family N-acetyltransferase [Paeniclostridium sordellii]MCQ4695992.1 GNAT family N-acetyltransferase [Paeniclostridium sordellii]MDU4412514.1 GNAT family N-acetyltransferase [Paeniclostridium sordellii]MDU6483546.1 GNAT family N-acetyltransferase [Paeniclostridium sordellii]MRZ29971.1 GNAT family N-acetyltransferase [Paeniclostridium sordellii]MVO73860.1 GNAT family N-acetyltransferase [Paeniclostridium sordellii]